MQKAETCASIQGTCNAKTLSINGQFRSYTEGLPMREDATTRETIILDSSHTLDAVSLTGSQWVYLGLVPGLGIATRAKELTGILQGPC